MKIDPGQLYEPPLVMIKATGHEMQKLNVIGIDTRLGFRTAELLQGDITGFDPPVDVLVVSVYTGSYLPLEGTVIRSLLVNHGIDSEQLSEDPGLDLRSALGVWISRPLDFGPARRLLFVEMRGGRWPIEEALDNVFAALMLLDGKGIPVGTVAMPLLGSGSQRLEPEKIAPALIQKVKFFLEKSTSASVIRFVEIEPARAGLISIAMDEALGRIRVTLPHEQLTEALRADVRNRLNHATDLFREDAKPLSDDWSRMLEGQAVNSVQFGVSARKLVELLLNRMSVKPGNLAQRIRTLEDSNEVAPWICGYMNVLRHLGNGAAHATPPVAGRTAHLIAPSDLTAGLYCVERLLDFWIARREVAPA